MILAGRLTTVYLSDKVRKGTLLGIMGFGYSMAGIYPSAVSFAGHLNRRYNMSWSFMLTLASLGSILMPTIIGKIADTAGIVYGMSSIVVVIIIDMVFIAMLTAYMRKNGLE